MGSETLSPARSDFEETLDREPNACPVETLRKALREIWAEEKQKLGTPRPETAKAARLATQISLGKGELWMLEELRS
ncbi:MAG: hypothetical protein MI892_22125, partial [Desulfobacterales bacterium]|nr:hypothetical protein [Desulfobacterales bacterium]